MDVGGVSWFAVGVLVGLAMVWGRVSRVLFGEEDVAGCVAGVALICVVWMLVVA